MATKIVQIIMKIIVGLFIVLIAVGGVAIIVIGTQYLIYRFSLDYANNYTVDEHIERISKRVREKHMDGSEDFDIYPLYDANDEVHYVLVEFNPEGFFIVKIKKEGKNLYVAHEKKGASWVKWYKVEVEINGIKEVQHKVLTDEKGKELRYHSSPYKVANVLDEKKYFFDGMPVVKRDGKYVNLVSDEEINTDKTLNSFLWGDYAYEL